jgi:hypothetical protein
MKEICIRDGVCAEGAENIEKGLSSGKSRKDLSSLADLLP